MYHGQILHRQMLHGQLLPGQLLILTGFGKSWMTSIVKIWSITSEIWIPGQKSPEQLSLGQKSLGQISQEQMSSYVVPLNTLGMLVIFFSDEN